MNLWPRIQALLRKRAAILQIEADNRRRIGILEQMAALQGPAQLPFIPGGDGGPGGTWHDIFVYGTCYGNLAVVSGDAFIEGVQADSGAPLGYSYYLSSIVPINNGYARAFVPDYPVIYDNAGNPRLDAVPIAVLRGFTYAGGAVTLPADTLTNIAFLGPQTTPLVGAPAVYVNGTGSGAAVQGTGVGFNILSRGTGYSLNTGLTFDGYYGTGLNAVAEVGFVSGATITNPGTGGLNGFFNVGVIPAGHNATIKGTAGAHTGIVTWTIVDGGNCMGVDGTPVVFTVPAPSGGFGTRRTASIGGTVSGGAVNGIQIYDPGMGYTAGSTINATCARQGTGGFVGVSVSGGAVVSASIIGSNAGHGYYLSSPQLETDISFGGYGDFNPRVSVQVNTGIGSVDKTRNADSYVCFGTCGYPSKLTGTLTSQFGTVDVARTTDGSGNIIGVATQYAIGKMINAATVPNSYFANNEYYLIKYTMARDASAIIVYHATFTGGVLTGITIDNVGYGYPVVPSILLDANWSANVGLAAGTTLARFHFTLDGSGGASGYFIDVAGVAYKSGGSNFTGTVGPISLYDSAGAEYLLTCETWCLVSDVDGELFPDGQSSSANFGVGATATVRATSYTCGPLAATFDFKGTQVEGSVFQGGSSTEVDYQG